MTIDDIRIELIRLAVTNGQGDPLEAAKSWLDWISALPSEPAVNDVAIEARQINARAYGEARAKVTVLERRLKHGSL